MKRKHRLRRWFYFVTPVVSTTLTLLIIEFGFAIIHPIPFSVEKNMYFEPDPFTGYRLKANSIGFFQQRIPARVNKNGHRDEPVSIDKPPGTFRILVLGDSFTVGASVAQDETYADVLEKLLTKKALVPVEVINAGVGGWDPFQYAQYYEHYGWKFSPDLILVGFFVGNDTYQQTTDVSQLQTAVLGRRVSRKAASEGTIHLKVFMYNHSNIARLILNKGPTLRDLTRKNCSDFSDWFLKIQRDRLYNHRKRTRALEAQAKNGIDHLKRIKKLAERQSIPVGIVLIPDENQVNKDLQEALLKGEDRNKFDFDMPQSMLEEFLSDAMIPVIDLLPFFREDPRCLYMNDTHWTAEGHALAAEVIYENITNEKIWPDLTNRISGWH